MDHALAPLLGFVLLAAAQEPEPVRVVIPIGEAGEVDVADLVARLAERSGLAIDRPAGAPKLPTTGLAGALTWTLLAETLGPAARLTVRPRELVVTIDPAQLAPENLARWEARLKNLAERAIRESSRGARFGMAALKSYRPNDPGRPTICLVHGINSTAGSFVHLVGPLEAAGFGLVTYAYPYDRDLDVTAPAFARDWAAFRHRVGEARPWAVLTHSMGAMLVRPYVEGDGYAGDVSDLILIGPPNRGSAVAKAQTLLQLVRGMRAVGGGQAGAMARLSDGLGAAADDLSPGSAFLEALNRRPRRAGVRYHILAGDGGFLSAAARRQVEVQAGTLARSAGVLGGLTRLAAGDLSARLDELTEGLGDGCVSVASTRLEGVEDHVVIHANHVELIRGPLLYPEPGPVACLPFVLDRLGVKPKSSP